MRKINELKEERAGLISQMAEITENDVLTEEQRGQWSDLESKVNDLDSQINVLEKQERYNKEFVATNTNEREVKDLGAEMRDWLNDVVAGKSQRSFVIPATEFRADPLITTTQSGLIQKQVSNNLSVMQSPGEAFLRKLGVTFYEGLTGNFVVPNQTEVTGAFPGEGTAAGSAGLAPGALTLAGRRIAKRQQFTKELLAQTNPQIYNQLVQTLVDGLWTGVVYDLMDNVNVDAVDASTTIAGSTLAYGDLVTLEAGVPYELGNPAYVTTPTTAAFLKKTAALTNQSAIWQGKINDGEANGYNAYGLSAVNANNIIFGDWKNAVVGTWGGVELIVDPYTLASEEK